MVKISYTIRVPRASIEKEAFCIKTPEERAKMLQNILLFGLEVQEKFSLEPERVMFLKERSTGNIQIWVD
jgi:predicted phosphatase